MPAARRSDGPAEPPAEPSGAAHSVAAPLGAAHSVVGQSGPAHSVVGQSGKTHSHVGRSGKTHSHVGQSGSVHSAAGQLGPAHRAVLQALDERELVADLVRLVRVPSITGSAAESQLQHDLAGELTGLGMDVDHWPFDLAELRADPEFPGTEAERDEGWGLVATLPTAGGESEPGLILQGHTDVVPVGDPANWPDGDPFSARITGDVLHGRGSCDMKAGVAANLAVAKALVRSGLTLERPFALHHVASEEDGGLGAFATLRRGHRGAAAVITEPTSGRLLVANAGALTFRLEVPGRAAHGSTRLEGVSALEAFLRLHAAIGELEAERNADVPALFGDQGMPFGISIGIVRAGDWSSSVPDLLVAEGRYGVRLGEPVDAARAALQTTIERACAADPWLAEHPARLTFPGGQFASGQLEAGHSLAGEVADAVVAVGGPRPRPAAAPYGSDLRLYTGMGGIPTLQYGPGDVRMAHAPREQVSISETIAVARALAVLAVERLGAH